MPGKKFITFSYDDGTIHDRRMIEILDFYGLKCTFNLNSDRLGMVHTFRQGGLICDHSEVVAEEIAALYQNHEVAVHGLDHRTFTKLDDGALFAEAEQDRLALEKYWGHPVIGCAYPNGPYDDRVVEFLRSRTGIRYARTCECTYEFGMPSDFLRWHPTCSFENSGIFRMADRFFTEESEEDQLFYIYGHSYCFDRDHSWDRLEMLCRVLAFRPNCTYVTNGELYRYCQERK